MKAYAHKKTYTGMLTATSFIIASNGNNTKCPPACEWKNKPCYIHTEEYNSEMKRSDAWYKMDIFQK